MKLNDVLLGLVKLHPGVSGYELRRIISQSTQYFMNAQLSQIYPALKQMTEAGYMSFEEESTEGGRISKRYYLSPAGEERYMEWLREPLDYTFSMNAQRQFMLKLTFMGSLSHSEQIDFVQNALDYFRYEYEDLLTENLELESEYLTSNLPEHDDIMRFWRWEVAHLHRQDAALIAGLEDLLKELEGR